MITTENNVFKWELVFFSNPLHIADEVCGGHPSVSAKLIDLITSRFQQQGLRGLGDLEDLLSIPHSGFEYPGMCGTDRRDTFCFLALASRLASRAIKNCLRSASYFSG